MAREDEFAKIMKFFSMSQEERAQHFSDVFEQSVEFFNKFNHIMKEGSVQEKQEMINELQKLQQTVQDETEKLSETTGLSPEELKAFAEDESNFSKEQWEMIQRARSSIQKDASEVSNMLKFNDVDKDAPKKTSKPKQSKSDWLKS